MKHYPLLLLILFVFLSGCNNLDDNEGSDPYSQNALPPYYLLSCFPEFPSVGNEGGDVTIIVSAPETTRFSKTRYGLRNEFFGEGNNFDSPFVKSIVRKQIDDYSVQYTFTFDKNLTGKSRYIESRIYDTTYGYWSKDSGYIGYGLGVLRITQSE